MWGLPAVHSQPCAPAQQAAPAPLPSGSSPQGYELPMVLPVWGGPRLTWQSTAARGSGITAVLQEHSATAKSPQLCSLPCSEPKDCIPWSPTSCRPPCSMPELRQPQSSPLQSSSACYRPLSESQTPLPFLPQHTATSPGHLHAPAKRGAWPQLSLKSPPGSAPD